MPKQIKYKKPKVIIPTCDKCGAEVEHPVANEFRGRIEWICWKCYQRKRGAI